MCLLNQYTKQCKKKTFRYTYIYLLLLDTVVYLLIGLLGVNAFIIIVVILH